MVGGVIRWCCRRRHLPSTLRPAVLGKPHTCLVHPFLLLFLRPLRNIIVLFAAFDNVLTRRKKHASPLWEVNKTHRNCTNYNHDTHNDALAKNINWVSPDPKFPPAPVIPEMMPSDRREMKGMMPNVAPHAACAPMEKRIIKVMAKGSEFTRPSKRQQTPPAVCRSHRFQSRPRIPHRLAMYECVYLAEFIFGNITLLLKSTEVTIGEILAKNQHQYPHDYVKPPSKGGDESGKERDPGEVEGSHVRSLKTLALCSESTGRSNLAVVSVGTMGDATEKANTGSRPVTPCMEVPGDPSISGIVETRHYRLEIRIYVHGSLATVPEQSSGQ
ncbi:hypothetical protein Ccrd_021576 [Cynara cardunculus var. scolymus]|uniref:Uncharacterized protein n=1 Tax=Cynara cardunculus var. scolymus TaxID=59895 RepID=A0A103Y089_CYNCS|nr:hypothetical protein Ccrd_021576 [Cynara cardunculus var. scolymus]